MKPIELQYLPLTCTLGYTDLSFLHNYSNCVYGIGNYPATVARSNLHRRVSKQVGISPLKRNWVKPIKEGELG